MSALALRRPPTTRIECGRFGSRCVRSPSARTARIARGARRAGHDRGIILGDPTHFGDQAVERCYALDRRPWGEIDPIVRCEVLATLTEIAQRA